MDSPLRSSGVVEISCRFVFDFNSKISTKFQLLSTSCKSSDPTPRPGLYPNLRFFYVCSRLWLYCPGVSGRFGTQTGLRRSAHFSSGSPPAPFRRFSAIYFFAFWSTCYFLLIFLARFFLIFLNSIFAK